MTSGAGPLGGVRVWARAMIVIVLLNACFFAFLVMVGLVPRDRLRDRVTEAFADRSIVLANRLPYNTSIGYNQYNDCLILQMISNEDGRIRRALGPVLYYRDDFKDMCALTRDLALVGDGQRVPAGLQSFRYSRYWHGHNAVTALALGIVPLRVAREMFRWGTYLAAFVLLLSAFRQSGSLRILGVCAATGALVYWGLQSFAQSPAHGPANSMELLGLAAFMVAGPRLHDRSRLVVACAAFGALLTYFELLTGVLPTAASILLPVLYFSGDAGGSGWRRTVEGILAFTLGVAMTFLIRTALAVAAFGPELLATSSGNLAYYSQTGDVNRLVAAVRAALYRVSDSGAMLTYGSRVGMAFLFGAALLAWVVALTLALRKRSAASSNAFLACAAGASLVAAWIFLLPTHTLNHPYMIRMFMAPVALGFAALMFQVRHSR